MTPDEVRAGVAGLPEREAEVLRLRFGLDGEPLTLRQTGALLGLSAARIGQLERMALRRLRRALTATPEGLRC